MDLAYIAQGIVSALGERLRPYAGLIVSLGCGSVFALLVDTLYVKDGLRMMLDSICR